jgi:N-acyl-D-aspartate/D-glutamate deacylase
MTSKQIASMLGAMKRSFEAGNIGMSNYKANLAKLFSYAEGLAENVASLEAKVAALSNNSLGNIPSKDEVTNG